MMLNEMRAYFLSPALPAAGLLCGMVFFLAFSHFMSLRWQPAATITLYSVLLVWVSSLAWRERKRWGGIGGLDALFVAFILLVLASLVVQGAHTVGWKYGRYLPFLAIGPYVCGRLMRTQDVQLLSGILAFAGLVMLVLLALDYWENLTALTVYSRWHFFGYGYTPLLVGMLFASSLVVWSFPSLTGGSGSGELLSLRKAGRLLALGLVAAALVGVAARGAVLAGVVSMFSLVVIVRQWSLSRKFLLLLYLTAIMLFTYWILPAPQAQGYRSLGALSIENTLGEVLSNSSVPGLIGWVLKLPQWNWVPAHLVWEPILGKESCAPLYEGIDSLAIRILLHREAIAMFVSSPWWGAAQRHLGGIPALVRWGSRTVPCCR